MKVSEVTPRCFMIHSSASVPLAIRVVPLRTSVNPAPLAFLPRMMDIPSSSVISTRWEPSPFIRLIPSFVSRPIPK